MPHPININTASQKQLEEISGIGAKRAQKLINKREEKGKPLTIEDVKLMSDIPNTMWDPLIESGLITFEAKNVEDQAEGGTLSEGEKVKKLEKIIESLQKDFEELKQGKNLMESDYQQKTHTLQIDMKTKLKNLQHDHDKEQEELEAKYRKEIAELQESSKNREIQLMEELKEKDDRIQQISEAAYIEKNYKEDMKILLNTKSPTVSGNDATKENISKKVNEKTETETKYSCSYSNKQYGPMPPKMGTYDGTTDWRPYFIQFEHIADRYHWLDSDRLDKLIECLRDKALAYFTTRPQVVRNSYKLICQKMNERFGRRDLPTVIRRQLQELRQLPDESLDEYAERAQELATDGFPNTPDDFIQIVATDAFLKGCSDKKAAYTAIDKDPDTLDKALQLVKAAITNQRIIFGTKRTEVKRVTFQDDDEESSSVEEENNSAVRAVYRKEEFDMAQFEARLRKTEENLKRTKDDVKEILTILQNDPSRSRSRQRSPSPRRGKCYACGKEGHFKSECENKRDDSRSRSPSPNRTKSLNYQGLKP